MTRILGPVEVALLALLTLLVLLLLVASGCHPDAGERCNPLLFNDECADGLQCLYPPGCGVAFCCPPNAPSPLATCQVCPVTDGGTD